MIYCGVVEERTGCRFFCGFSDAKLRSQRHLAHYEAEYSPSQLSEDLYFSEVLLAALLPAFDPSLIPSLTDCGKNSEAIVPANDAP